MTFPYMSWRNILFRIYLNNEGAVRVQEQTLQVFMPSATPVSPPFPGKGMASAQGATCPGNGVQTAGERNRPGTGFQQRKTERALCE